MDDAGIERVLQLSSPKVLAMYEAVNELLEEGRDIYRMKISEITQRAGIGKGTAYEYFSTKEELLGKAIFYQLHRGICRMTEEALKQDSFRKQVYAVLDDIEKNYSKRRVLLQYLCYYVLGACAENKCDGKKHAMLTEGNRIKRVVSHMFVQAKKEGLAQEIPEFLMTNTLLTQCMGFCMYLERGDCTEDMDMERMKAFVYESIVRILGGMT